jgi:hypothetical protein
MTRPASTLLLGALLVLASPALGQTAPDDRVRQAAEAYDRGEFDHALELLQAAFDESQKPALLFNMAQVQRSKNDCATAAATYRRFLDTTTPDDPNRPRAERYEGDMQACAARAAEPKTQQALDSPDLSPRPPTGNAGGPALEESHPAPSPDQPEPTWSPRKIAAYALIGAGIAAAGASGILQLQAKRNSSSRTAISVAEYEARLKQGEQQKTLARVFGVSALVSAGAGVTLVVF